MKIGYLRDDYPEIRCIIGKTDSAYVKLDRRADLEWAKWAIRKILGLNGRSVDWNTLCAYRPLFKNAVAAKVDLIHTFNHVCFADIPWVVTLESMVPRTNYTVNRPWERDSEACCPDRFTEKELQLLACTNCRAIIAISNSAFKIQDCMLHSIAPDLYNDIMDKTIISHPPQETLCTEADVHHRFSADVASKRGLEFVFVGADFFRKGGQQIIDVLSEFEDTFKFHLTVISTVNYGDYVSHASKTEKEKYTRLMQAKPWVTWYNGLDNMSVLEIMKKSHVGLLPTLADTYGYSVLEMQACGLPVVTTDVRALPEINDNECGWVCHLTKDNIGGEAILINEEERAKRKEELNSELRRVFEEIFRTEPEKIKEKGIKSLERIRIEHDPVKYGNEIYKIYKTGVGRN